MMGAIAASACSGVTPGFRRPKAARSAPSNLSSGYSCCGWRISVPARHGESGRQDADYGNPLAVQNDGSVDGACIRAEAPGPDLVADDRDRRHATHVILGREIAAQGDPHAKRLKEVAFDRGTPQTLGLLPGDVARVAHAGRGGHGEERLRRRFPTLCVLAGGEEYWALALDRRKRHAQVHQPIGIAVGQRAEQNPVKRAEHRGGGAKPQGEHQPDAQREARLAPPRPQGEMHVLSQCVPPFGDPDAAHRLARVQQVAETPPRGGLVHAIVLGAHRDVRLEFFPHLIVRWTSSEPVALHTHRKPSRAPGVASGFPPPLRFGEARRSAKRGGGSRTNEGSPFMTVRLQAVRLKPDTTGNREPH
jgi:hypothetical protein